ncbi:MAG: iron-sulfur cluster repair di-iron protein [Vicinamibacteraceae bacterium]
MTITTSTLVADIATTSPATIKVFQRHRIDFCCGGKIPLGEVCAAHDLAAPLLIGELEAATNATEPAIDWTQASLTSLVSHIQSRYHRPLEVEVPRLRAMVDKVVSRHGARLPRLALLQATFAGLQDELLAHMKKEDVVLFPAIVALEAGAAPDRTAGWRWIEQPIAVMEAEHASAGAALARIAELTDGFVAPEDACPTFLGLYYGLAELERDMHVHVHLENHILFPRAAAMAGAVRRQVGRN